jgi:hypothetical protein
VLNTLAGSPVKIGGDGGTPPSRSSYLDLQETNAHQCQLEWPSQVEPPRDEYRVEPILPVEAVFRHSGWQHARRLIWSAFIELHQPAPRLDAFANCGSCCRVEVSKDGKDFRLTANYCHDRWCLPCGKARSAEICSVLSDLTDKKTVRFVTLTLRHSDTALKAQIDRLYDAFAKLRRRDFWKKHVKGGACFLELKVSRSGRQWHPHLHILVETPWLPQKDLSRAWHEITGDSYIVDVRPIRSRGELLAYVTKYASKPMDASVYNNRPKLLEAIQALKGRRLCLTFGTWRGVELRCPPAAAGDWLVVGSYADLLFAAANQDASAIRILESLQRRKDNTS